MHKGGSEVGSMAKHVVELVMMWRLHKAMTEIYQDYVLS